MGLGGEKCDGRWHTASRGKRIVYFSEHPAVALIEVLVNLEGDAALLPGTFQLMKAEATENVSTSVMSPDALPTDCRSDTRITQAIGDDWLKSASSALLAVPSVPSPESWNYLFNPLHKDAPGVAIAWCKTLEYDRRLFRLR